MGIQLEVRQTLIRVSKMKTTLCLILSALTIVSQARPQYGSSNNNNGRQPGGNFGQQTQVRPTARPSFLPQGCRIEYKVVYSVEEREEYENKCETKYRQECQNKFQRICNPYREKQCQTDYKRQCDTNWKQECNQLYKDVQQEYQAEECKDQEVPKIGSIIQLPARPFGRPTATLSPSTRPSRNPTKNATGSLTKPVMTYLTRIVIGSTERNVKMLPIKTAMMCHGKIVNKSTSRYLIKLPGGDPIECAIIRIPMNSPMLKSINLRS